MITLLEEHVKAKRIASEDAAQVAFEQRYPEVLPFLRDSDVRYFVEQDLLSAGGQLWLKLFTWDRGYLYSRRWPLRADGTVEYQNVGLAPTALAELVLEEVTNWAKWQAAQAWQEKRYLWRAGRTALAILAFWAVVLFFLLPDEVTLVCASVSVLLCLAVATGVRIDRNRHFPQGYTSKPEHVLYHTKVTDGGGPVTYSSSNGQYIR
jgi:hypothetical protein